MPLQETLPAEGAEPRSALLEPGAAVGRYVILQQLGAGGMGVVYAAYDPELDRKVALKFLHVSAYDRRDGDRMRLRREAQAMAKLSHPNVVMVHDVGEHDGAVYIAMESVDGRTLRRWLTQQRRSWREVLAVFIAAGEGLAAAHAEGIVHRDFKPENVMVGDDGRVRVMDFGLAAPTSTGKIRSLSADEASAPLAPLSQRLSRKQVAGTPAYMAPEQYQDFEVGRPADQFAFCVALWEGLHGERPFRSDSPLSVVAAASSGVRPRPPGSRVPGWLRRAVERGFAVDPTKRWPSMEELLAALRAGSPRMRHTLIAGAVILVLGLAGAGVGAHLHREGQLAACGEVGAAIAEVWSPTVRDKVTTNVVDIGGPHALETAERITPWLDDYASQWQQRRTDACVEAETGHGLESPLRQRAVACLEERRHALAELVDRLRDADTETMVHAVTAATELPPVDACRDPVALRRLPAAPLEEHDQVLEIRRRLARARALQLTGAPEEAVSVARAALADARELSWLPLQADAGLALGRVLKRTGAHDEAERTLEAAYFDGMRSGATVPAFHAALTLARFVGADRARPGDGRRWANLADLVRAQLPTLSGLHEASLLAARATIERRAGEFDEAVGYGERALRLCEAAVGPDHPEVAAVLNTLGNARVEQGAYREGNDHLERALAIHEATLGPTHPTVAGVLSNLASSDFSTGHADRALQRQQRALEIKEAVHGPDHETVAVTLNNLAVLRFAGGEDEEALALYERALEIFERVHGPEHPRVGRAEVNIAKVLRRAGKLDAAQRRLERALAVYEHALGPDHVQVAEVLNQSGLLAHNRGRFAEARRTLARAAQIVEAKLSPDHPRLAGLLSNQATAVEADGDLDAAAAIYERALAIFEHAEGPAASASHPLLGLARIARSRGDLAEAVRHAERALQLRSGAAALPVELAEARFELARALEAHGPGSERARVLARQAADAYRELSRPELSEVERFRSTFRP